MREDKIGLERGTNISARHTICALCEPNFFVWIFLSAYLKGSEELSCIAQYCCLLRDMVWASAGCCFFVPILRFGATWRCVGGLSSLTPSTKRAHGYSYLCMVDFRTKFGCASVRVIRQTRNKQKIAFSLT